MAYIVSVGSLLSPEFIGPFDTKVQAQEWAAEHNMPEEKYWVNNYAEVITLIPDDNTPTPTPVESSDDSVFVHGTAQYADPHTFEPEIELDEVVEESVHHILSENDGMQYPVFYCGDNECSSSTGICGSATFGKGKLSDNGYWEFPCTQCARAYNDEGDRYYKCTKCVGLKFSTSAPSLSACPDCDTPLTEITSTEYYSNEVSNSGPPSHSLECDSLDDSPFDFDRTEYLSNES